MISKLIEKLRVRLFDWLCRDLTKRHYSLAERFDHLHSRVGEIDKRARAITALDVGQRDNGFVVVAAIVNGEHRVQAWTVRPMPLQDWKHLDRLLTEAYGAHNNLTDLPHANREIWRAWDR